jgi:D-serine deaminase-like pyridoxal phosphate-dependent protein
VYPDLDTPSVLLDLDRLEFNLGRMAGLARNANLTLRPHTKTHKSPVIAKMQLAAGATGITVAKLGEAEVMAAHGLADILIAFPLIGEHKMARLATLHQKATIMTSTDSLEVARALNQVGEQTGKPLSVYIEVDTGLGRCGTLPGEATVQWVRQLKELAGIRVTGVMTHEGHSWAATTFEEQKTILANTSQALAATAEALRREGFPCEVVSVGATPTAFHAEVAKGATEMRPGTYIFNDYFTLKTGNVTEKECAVTVLATIVGRPTATRVILDTGSKTLSQDGASSGELGYIIGKPGWKLVKLTEEHGLVQVPEGTEVKIGERLELIPNHVCVVTNLADAFVTKRGREIIGTLEVAARGKVQ